MTPTPSAAPAEPSKAEQLNELRAEAVEIFDGPETAQAVRDVIEWYDASIRVVLARADAPKGEPTTEPSLNQWFLALPEGRQSVLVDDKWMLAEAAYQAGKALASKGKATATDAEIVKVYQGACEYADKLQQGFSWGRMQALRAVFDMGRAAQPSPTMAEHQHTWKSAPNQAGVQREVCDCGAMRSGVYAMADAIAAGEPTAKAPFTYCEKCGNAAAVGLTCTCDVPKPTLDFVLDAVDEFEAMHSNACHDQATNSDHVACKTAKVRLQKTIIALHTYGASSAGTPPAIAAGEPTLQQIDAASDEVFGNVDVDWRRQNREFARAVLALRAGRKMNALQLIAEIAEGSGTVNSLQHISKIARTALAAEGAQQAREPADAKDAARGRFLIDNWLNMVDGIRLHAWVGQRAFSIGGIEAAVDEAMRGAGQSGEATK